MTLVKKLIFFGDDNEFLERLKHFAATNIKENYEISIKAYNKGSLIDCLSNEGANIIYYDFTFNQSHEDFYDEIIFIKRIEKFRSILFTALICDTSNIQELVLLYSSGFQLGYVKGNESENFIKDSFYIGLAEKIIMPTYVRAKKIELDLKVGLCSSIAEISQEKFLIETDLDIEDEELRLSLNFFEDLEADSFKITNHKTISYLYPMTDTYTLDYPYVGPWDDITNKTIQKETVETWLDINKENLKSKHDFTKIISNNSALYTEILKLNKEIALFIEINSTIEIDSIKQELILKRPQLFFIDLEQDGAINIETVSELINCIRSLGIYDPVVVIANCPSKANALQKVYEYKNIIAMPTGLSIDIIESFLKSFIDKKDQSNSSEEFYFENNNILRAIDILHTVNLISLNEHEITFVSEVDLPLFTVLHLKLPVECFVTIVPSYIKLSSNNKGKHYMGLIHSMSEVNKQSLRKFINQIIYEPITEINQEIVEKLLKRETIESEIEKTPSIEEEKDAVEHVIDYTTFKRPKSREKSKL